MATAGTALSMLGTSPAYLVDKHGGTGFGQLALRGGLSQRQIMLQAAPSSGQPRPISRLVPVGIGHTGLAFGIGVGCGLLRDYLASAQLPTGLRRVRDPL